MATRPTLAPGKESEPEEVAFPDRGAPSRSERVLDFIAGRPEAGAFFAAVAMFLFFSFWAENFLTAESINQTLILSAELGVVAIAVTLLMIAGEFDLSVGSVLGFSSVMVPYLMVNDGFAAGVALACAFLIAISIGLINGLVTIKLGIPSFIATLGALLFWRGVLQAITEGFPISVPQDTFLLDVFGFRFSNGFPVAAFWFAGMLVILAVLLTRTRFGNWIFAAGGNEKAARSMGVPVDRVRLGLFVLTAVAACIAGLIQVGRFGSVDATRGLNLELEAIAAAVIGGARLTGGYGSVIGTALGVLMLGMMRNGLALGGVADYWYTAIVGLLIVLAVVINQTISRQTGRRSGRAA